MLEILPDTFLWISIHLHVPVEIDGVLFCFDLICYKSAESTPLLSTLQHAAVTAPRENIYDDTVHFHGAQRSMLCPRRGLIRHSPPVGHLALFQFFSFYKSCRRDHLCTHLLHAVVFFLGWPRRGVICGSRDLCALGLSVTTTKLPPKIAVPTLTVTICPTRRTTWGPGQEASSL